MVSKLQTQIAWQRRAVWIINEYLLDLASRNSLPALNWSISDTGVVIMGTSYVLPSSTRHKYVAAWARALNIELGEHEHGGVITVSGIAEQVQTNFGHAKIMLNCDVHLAEEKGCRAHPGYGSLIAQHRQTRGPAGAMDAGSSEARCRP